MTDRLDQGSGSKRKVPCNEYSGVRGLMSDSAFQPPIRRHQLQLECRVDPRAIRELAGRENRRVGLNDKVAARYVLGQSTAVAPRHSGARPDQPHARELPTTLERHRRAQVSEFAAFFQQFRDLSGQDDHVFACAPVVHGDLRAKAQGAARTIHRGIAPADHRHLDIALRLPRGLTALEMDARRLVQSRLERGRVEVSVQLSPLAGTPLQQVRIDRALARSWVMEARGLAHELALGDDVHLTWVLERPGVARLEDADTPEPSVAWPTLAQALGDALDGLVERRSVEGAALAAELRALHADLGVTVAQIAERVPAVMVRRTERLRERIRGLLGDATMDENRVATEVAVWAERTDITEELVRLRAHLEQFALTLDKGGPVGRLLDFLIQEMNREVNTVGSKAEGPAVSEVIVALKAELEKMREQVQNVE